MRRVLIALAGAAVLTAGLAAPAAAEKQTIEATDDGPIKKIKVSNGEHKIITKIFAPGGRSRVDWMTVNIKRKSDNKGYHIWAGWKDEDTWKKQIAWEGNDPRSCDDFKVVYNDEDNYWRVVVPRSCVDKLTNKVKVDVTLDSEAKVIPGYVGPTRWLERG